MAITIARRAASSTLALDRTLARRLALLAGVPESTQPSLPWEDDEDEDGSGGELLAAPGLESATEERATLEHLRALIATCGSGAKLSWLRQTLARVREPAIIFTEYRDTLDAVVAELPASARVGVISGAHPPHERRDIVDLFNRGELDVLAATDAAGEGLNLHHRCRLVIDLELPWNPLRLEQRIGRVDRLGQLRRVHAWRLFHVNTVEQRVLERLRLRQRRAGLTADRLVTSELEVAHGVFDGTEPPSAATVVVEGTTVPGAVAERHRLEQQRANHVPPDELESLLTVPKRRSRTTRFVALHLVSCATESGVVIAEQAVAHGIEIGAPGSSRDWRSVVESALIGRLAGGVEACSQRLCDVTAHDLGPLRFALAQRITSIRSHVTAARAREIQPSLFDHRAGDAEAHDAEITARLDEALRRRLDGVTLAAKLEDVSARLVAVWPLGAR